MARDSARSPVPIARSVGCAPRFPFDLSCAVCPLTKHRATRASDHCLERCPGVFLTPGMSRTIRSRIAVWHGAEQPSSSIDIYCEQESRSCLCLCLWTHQFPNACTEDTPRYSRRHQAPTKPELRINHTHQPRHPEHKHAHKKLQVRSLHQCRPRQWRRALRSPPIVSPTASGATSHGRGSRPNKARLLPPP